MFSREEQWLLEEKYNGEKTEGFFSDRERLQAGEPLAYIIGHVPFLGVTIFLDSPQVCQKDAEGQACTRPLIPRPETEYWVHEAIQEIKLSHMAAPRVLDLCAGSGCIGVATQKALPHAHVDFAEREIRHHDTIRRNIERNGLDPKKNGILGGDLFEHIPGQYDYILTNPPYIDEALKRVDPEVVAHEPHEALFGGADGLLYIGRIINTAAQHLTESGVLYIEHEPEQSEAIRHIATHNNFFVDIRTDQYGLVRYTRLTRVLR